MESTRARILWLYHMVPYPPKAGVLIRSHNLCKELSKAFHVDLLAFNQPALMQGCFGDSDEGLKISRAALSQFLEILGVEPIPFERSNFRKQYLALASLFSRMPYSVRWLHSRGYAAGVSRALASHKYDLIHVDTESLIPYVTGNTSCPMVLDHHNIESHMLFRRSENEPGRLKATYFKLEAGKLLRFEKANFVGFSSHIVCSEEDRNRLLDIEPRARVFVAPNGVEFPQRAVNRRNGGTGDVRLLFVGGLTWYPNQDAVTHFLQDIWPALTARIPGISIDIVGKSPSAKIRELAGRFPGVRLHGFVDDIQSFYSNATVYVCPIRDGGGTKLKVVDAIANGVPMIAHPIACEGLDLQHGGHVLFARTVEDYVNAITSVRDDFAAAMQMAARAYDFTRARYSSDAIGRNLAHHYMSLMEDFRRRAVS